MEGFNKTEIPTYITDDWLGDKRAHSLWPDPPELLVELLLQPRHVRLLRLAIPHPR